MSGTCKKYRASLESLSYFYIKKITPYHTDALICPCIARYGILRLQAVKIFFDPCIIVLIWKELWTSSPMWHRLRCSSLRLFFIHLKPQTSSTVSGTFLHFPLAVCCFRYTQWLTSQIKVGVSVCGWCKYTLLYYKIVFLKTYYLFAFEVRKRFKRVSLEYS